LDIIRSLVTDLSTAMHSFDGKRYIFMLIFCDWISSDDFIEKNFTVESHSHGNKNLNFEVIIGQHFAELY